MCHIYIFQFDNDNSMVARSIHISYGWTHEMCCVMFKDYTYTIGFNVHADIYFLLFCSIVLYIFDDIYLMI